MDCAQPEVTLREHLERVLDEYREAHAREHMMLSASVEQAREVLGVKLESINQFRTQVQADRATLMTRELFDVQYALLDRRLAVIEASMANMRGRSAAYTVVVGLVFSALQLILWLVGAK